MLYPIPFRKDIPTGSIEAEVLRITKWITGDTYEYEIVPTLAISLKTADDFGFTFDPDLTDVPDTAAYAVICDIDGIWREWGLLYIEGKKDAVDHVSLSHVIRI